ncbi:hypothetical protein CPB86DRAFT_878443 [Serendipita vermifera]|nr:hypothetical protein CPB86DRAFT_878443 [Serendipita vermifera]
MSSKTKYQRIKKEIVEQPNLAHSPEVEVEMADATITDDSLTISMSAFNHVNDILQSLMQKIDQLQLEVDSGKINSGQKLLPGIMLDHRAYDGDLETASICSRRSPETRLVRNIMRAYARERLGIEGLEDIADWPTPDHDVAADYNANVPHAIGPTDEELIIDWSITGRTPWTKACAEIFARDFCSQHGKGAFPLIQAHGVENSEIKRFFLIYVVGLKRKYRQASDDPVAAKEQQTAANQRARSLNRRKQVYNRRAKLLQHHGFPPEAIEMVKDLGADGMSSEESDGEIGTTNRTFKIKRLRWRNRDITAFLHQVDELPTRNSENRNLFRLAPSRTRIIKDIDSVNRSAVRGLHKNIYDPDWLNQQDQRKKDELNPRESLFDIPKVGAYMA